MEERLRSTPAVVLLGPRQVGKTTLARTIAKKRGDRALYLDLERPADLRKLEDADAFLRAQSGKLVIVDEIHRAPELFAVLRGVIDDRRAGGSSAGHFLLLGSAALDLMRQAAESLAGRVAYLELGPFDLLETTEGIEVRDLWVRGGFPNSLPAAGDAESVDWRRDFVRSYLERDVPMFAPRLPAETVGRLWRMLAHAQGSPLHQSRLAGALGVSSPSVGRYVDLLADLMLIRRLGPWSGNVGKRLVRSPKTYIRDSGLAHALLELDSWEDVLGHPVAGASWEGFVIENAIAAAGPERTPSFYRTEDGAEIDLVFERGGSVEIAIEIKRASAPSLSRGFRLACDVLRPKNAFLVHGGEGEWPIDGGAVIALPPEGLVRRLAASRARTTKKAGKPRE